MFVIANNNKTALDLFIILNATAFIYYELPRKKRWLDYCVCDILRPDVSINNTPEDLMVNQS